MAKFSLLFAEDEEEIRLVVQSYIQDYTEIDIDCVEDGLEAQKKLEHKKYDVVLTDLKMPRFTGLDLLKWIREAGGQNKNIPVLVASGFVDQHFEELSSYERVFFLSKPYQCKDLLMHLNRVYSQCNQIKMTRKFIAGEGFDEEMVGMKVVISGRVRVTKSGQVEEIICDPTSPDLHMIDLSEVDKIEFLEETILAKV